MEINIKMEKNFQPYSSIDLIEQNIIITHICCEAEVFKYENT